MGELADPAGLLTRCYTRVGSIPTVVANEALLQKFADLV